LGKGCAFWFTLNLPIVKQLPQSSTLTLMPSSTEPLKAHILLAEDDKINQMVAEMMLEELDCQVDVANHGEEAVAMSADQQYHLILMDIHMPVLDGYGATQRIRAREQGTKNHLVIIAMTANAIASDLEKCLTIGMDDVLIKPVAKTTLAQMLTKWLASPPPTQLH
jgi:CheY-like chemotaxis protein